MPLEQFSLVAASLLQLSMQQHLRDSVVLLSDDVSSPSQLELNDQPLNAAETALLHDLEVGLCPVTWCCRSSVTSLMLQFLDLQAPGGQRLAAIQKCAQDHKSVHDTHIGEADAVVLLKPLCQLAEGCTHLSNPHHLSDQGSTDYNSATQVAEIVYSLDLSVINDDGRRWKYVGTL